MAIEENIITEFPNMMGHFIDFILNFIASLFSSMIIILIAFSLFSIIMVLMKIFSEKFVRSD